MVGAQRGDPQPCHQPSTPGPLLCRTLPDSNSRAGAVGRLLLVSRRTVWAQSPAGGEALR